MELKLYSRVNVVSDEALMAMESLSIMDELDSEPTLEDINQALDQLSSGKAPGNDGIPIERESRKVQPTSQKFEKTAI